MKSLIGLLALSPGLSHWASLFLSPVYPRPPLISRPWALRKVTLSLWWCFDSSLPLLSPPTVPFHLLSLAGKLESHYHQGAKKGLVPSAAEWRHWKKKKQEEDDEKPSGWLQFRVDGIPFYILPQSPQGRPNLLSRVVNRHFITCI